LNFQEFILFTGMLFTAMTSWHLLWQVDLNVLKVIKLPEKTD